MSLRYARPYYCSRWMDWNLWGKSPGQISRRPLRRKMFASPHGSESCRTLRPAPQGLRAMRKTARERPPVLG